MTQEEWRAIRDNDSRYDGVFYYGLRTTRIVCKPSCPARDCLPRNVIIFERLEDALQQGFRPCRRCRPEQPGFHGARQELVERAGQYLAAHTAEPFHLDQTADALYVNKSYLARTFRELTGKTLLEAHEELRIAGAKDLLTRMELSVTQISFRCGFSSSSHFTRVFRRVTGLTPSAWRVQYLEEIDR